MSVFRQYFVFPVSITVLGLLLVVVVGWQTTGTITGTLSFFLIGVALAVLEISLSFDNAIVNANKLQHMDPKWQRRFLTWGILIAVFGMRVVFPIAIVAVAAHIGPLAAVTLALTDPDEYGRLISQSHVSISAFGGTFLMMVALTYFVDEEKEVDWFRVLEGKLRQLASIRGLEIALVLAIILTFAWVLADAARGAFLFAATFGLLTFLIIELFGRIIDRANEARDAARAGGLGAFLYLEVLDASFSFDGVIGAFALTKNLILIAIGLGIGAVYVRAMTIMLVETKTLATFRYLEHGAFYSVFFLSAVMFAQSIVHIPEVLTGTVGIMFIGLALLSSLRYNRLMARREI